MDLHFFKKIPLVQTFRNYKLRFLKVDLFAGLTVGIITFPQALAFAVLAGVPPIWGIYSSIITGTLAALFGGSEHNITGPTSALALILSGIVAAHGVDSVMTMALIMGGYQIVFAFFRLGKMINFMPYTVLVGFASGLGVLIFMTQLAKIFGVQEGDVHTFFALLQNVYLQINAINPIALILGVMTILMIVILSKISKNIPGALIAVVVCAFFTYFFDLHIATIGAFDVNFPKPNLGAFDWELIKVLLAPAGALALLASVESLSTAAVAEKTTKEKFNANFELFGQGLANVVISFFQGIPGTGSFSRTAANIRSHAHTRLAAIFHAVTILLIVLFLGNYGHYIPFASLAGILIIVAAQMIEIRQIRLIIKTKYSDALVFLATFLITLFVDLITAIEVGVILAILLTLKTLSDSELQTIALHENKRQEKDDLIENNELCRQVILLEMSHPLFFAAASNFAVKLNKILDDEVRVLILRMKNVDYIDFTGISILEDILEQIEKKGGTVIFARMQKSVFSTIKRAGGDDLLKKEHHATRTRQAVKMAMKYVDPQFCKHRCRHRLVKECP